MIAFIKSNPFGIAVGVMQWGAGAWAWSNDKPWLGALWFLYGVTCILLAYVEYTR